MVVTEAATLSRVDVQGLRGELEQRGVRFLLASFVGMSGISKAKLEEWRSYHDAVSQWEIDRYLEVY